MNNTFNTENIKNEITRWATVKTPALYDHFSTYLGIPSKEIRKLFIESQEIQDHINQYFQEEKIQEKLEREENLKKDLATLEALFKTAVEKKKIFLVKALVKSTGIPRCNIKTFSKENSELWEMVVGPTAIAERKRIKTERKAAIEARHAENRRLKALRKAELDALVKARKEQKEAKAAYLLVVAERKAQLEELQAQKKAEREIIRLEKIQQRYETFGSYIGNELRYEKGRLVKKLEFFISNLDLVKIGFTGHINFIFGDDNCCGIYVQHEADHLGTFPTRINKDFHKFEITWNKRICDEPAEHTRAPLHLHLVETPHNNGFYFKIPERFFLGYIPD
ncbi:uncharacterized Zn finger protein (UPF0148 family) [Massilia sp. UYP11]|uniref:hypothetical protein n=1 Tax=Massilia sp. UYP11 TaxID=1756385 RepID=UPI003D261EF6